jgi:hypothetical protein
LNAVGISNPLEDDLDALVPGKQAVAAFYAARGPGSHGNAVHVSIVADNSAIAPVTSFTATPSTTLTGALNPQTTYEYYVSPIMADGERNAVKVTVTTAALFNGAITLSWAAVSGAIGYYVYGRVAGQLGRLSTVGIGSGPTISYTDAGLTVPSLGNQPITALSTTFQNRPFTVNVFDGSVSIATPVESFSCTLKPFLDSNGVQLELEERINKFSKYIRVVSKAFALLALPNVTSQARVAFTGGNSGTAPRSSQVVAALQPFASRQKYNVNLIINGGLADPMIQRAMDKVARTRGDCVALLDVPSGYQEWNKTIDYRNLILNLKSSYSALFAQDQLQVTNDSQVYAPLSGWAAALCARTDRVATPAHSIAGLNRGKLPVLGSRYQYDDDQASAMSRAQVNYTRTLTGQGVALWEQQTLCCDVNWLSVRRILNVIKTSLYTYLLYALQEMNTDSVRRELVNSCSVYLDRAQTAESISGYRVICDNSNNTNDTVNAGVLVLTVVIVPVTPIHEIQLNVVVSQSGVNFSEAIISPDGQVNSVSPSPDVDGDLNGVEYNSGVNLV